MISDLNPGCLEVMVGVEEDGGREFGAAVKKSSHVMNLVVRRAALYAPVLSHRRKMEALKSQTICVNPRQHIGGRLRDQRRWYECQGRLPSVKEIEPELLPNDYVTTEELATALKRWHLVDTVLRGFCGSEKAK
ncbi:hypothetical protein BGZ80_007385, partial [Entomortierella chlamydospora]